MKHRILLTNDDGISSPGLWAAYHALSPLADVSIVAPAAQQSAVGRSISIFEPIRADEVIINNVKAISVSGKPTDAVIIGLYGLCLCPSLVVSGINIGENLSYESIMTSGTVGAALEAANQGVKAVAFSLQVENQSDKFEDARFYRRSFDDTRRVVQHICERILERGFPESADAINVNIPSKISGGYEITGLAPKLFRTGVERRIDPRGRPYYWINGPLETDAEEGTDVHAIAKGAVSITPLTLNCTALKANETLREMFQ